jgi:hypothetical protein
MDINTFHRILTAFADGPADIDVSKGKLIVQIRDDVIEARLSNRSGTLIVTEDDTEYPAHLWIIQRIARLSLLADRILTHVTAEKYFVTPSGSLLDQLDESPDEGEQRIPDAQSCILRVLGRRPAGVTSVLYVTSDAGEGKTTLISQLARKQAQLYKDKQGDWLLVPISLGGRTFMRFDDVIIGTLVNRLRFPMLYYEAFVELVKLGAVVPALDGFEEMFVEGSAGEAVSALGSLVNTLQSSGTVLIAARKAYFEFRRLEAQTRLFDSLGDQSASFARLALERWGHSKFVEYANKRGIVNGEAIYQDVAAKLRDPNHPLLTRAVLVKRLLQVGSESRVRTDLLQRIENDPNDYFRQFVGTIIGREASEKWLDKKGEVAQPLITESEHYELLSAVALEMWSTASETLRADVLGVVAEVFSDSKKKDKVISNQIIERLKQHALIVPADGSLFRFDHQEFYHFFLGEAIGRMLVSLDKTGLAHAFRQGVLPRLCADVAVRFGLRQGITLMQAINLVNAICAVEPRASYVTENLGGMAVRFLEYAERQHVVVKRVSFPPDALVNVHFTDIEFEHCYFQHSSLDRTKLERCRFNRCEFEGLEIFSDSVIDDVVLHDCECRSVAQAASDIAVFAPRQVTFALEQANFTVTFSENRPVEQVRPPDERLALVERMLRAFMRSTGVNENTIQRRLGTKAGFFFRDVMPALVGCKVVIEDDYRGGGHQRRFRLGMALERIAGAMEDCNGDFERFVEISGAGESVSVSERR